jgi:hypothetical protein
MLLVENNKKILCHRLSRMSVISSSTVAYRQGSVGR